MDNRSTSNSLPNGVTMPAMAKPKKDESKDQKKDAHKVRSITLRLHAKIRGQLEKLVQQNASTINDEIRRAIRERLEREGLWPPPQS